ncbi:MAG TPA: SpoIIE family protein phosphatase [Thermoanaerobaculia bacterium]|jgi:serine phosphatase RsbU (regulator of sigma subunit)
MSPRKRLLIVLVLTLAAVGAALGFAIGRIHHWHGKGWTGVAYTPELPEQPKSSSKMGGFQNRPGEVVMTYAGSPADGKIHSFDEIILINGIDRADGKKLRALRERTRSGDSITYRIKRGTRLIDVPVQLTSPLRSPYVLTRTLLSFIVALTFIGIAFLVFVRQPRDRRAVVFYGFAAVSAMAVLGTAAAMLGQLGSAGIVPTIGVTAESAIVTVGICVAYPPLLLHLALVFPRPRPLLERRPYVVRWIYAVALLASMVMASGVMLLLNLMELVAGGAAATDRFGQNIATLVTAGVAIGLLMALQVIWSGRREGIVQAFLHRPFRSVFAMYALVLAMPMLLAKLGLKKVAAISAIGTTLLPLLILGLYPVLACISLVRSYRDANVEEKRQVQWPLWGLFIAVSTRFICLVTGFTLGVSMSYHHIPVTAWRWLFQTLDVVPLALSVLVPISFGVAILKYRLMNIDLIIRRTVVYAILSGAIIVLYLVLVGGLGTLLVNVAGMQNQTMVIASTLVVALLFVPLRTKLQTLVDRNLFRHKYDYPQALRTISADALTTNDLGEFLASAAEKIQQALQNRAVVIFLERHDELVATAKVGVSDAVLGSLRVPATFVGALDRPFDPRRRTVGDDAATALRRIETSLVVPIGNRGFVALAPKLSQGEFDVEDIDFLRSIADQLLVAIDRTRMHADEADFAQARAIQQSFLPREMPRVAGLDVSGIWQPARTVGGDYYDLLKLSDSELAFCIGDVAGKGMPAALLMSGLQAAVRATASPNGSPRDLCERVRRVVVSSLTGGRFVTFFYATLDTATMRLKWCNAGHNAPILARANGEIVRLSGGGSAISRLFRDTPFADHEIDVQPGDRIVLFTDGASEATDGAGEQFGEGKLAEIALAHRTRGAAELQRTIFDEALAFSQGELEDDLTLVVVAVA